MVRRMAARMARPMIATFVLWAAPLGATPPADGAPGDGCPGVTEVAIVSAVGGGEPDAGPRYARAGEVVTLYAVVEAEIGGRTVRFSEAPLAGRRARGLRRWPADCPAALSWAKVEAEVEFYNNARSLPPADVLYRETPWKDDGWQVLADVHPTLMHDEFRHLDPGLGTMRYRVALRTPAGIVRSPGSDCRERGVLCRSVHTVAYRKDDTYLGYLYELFNTPYIYGSKTVRGGHQADRLLGSDCADFVVYGKRRQRGPGAFAYTYTGGLGRLAKKRWPVALDDERFYVDQRRGRRLTFGPEGEIRPGDLINFEGGHVGALVRDDGDGYLDTGDYIMHTFAREPETVPIEDCRWGGIEGYEILRWKR